MNFLILIDKPLFDELFRFSALRAVQTYINLLSVESAEPMKELCTSPTRFNSPSAFHEPVSSPTSATKPPHRKSRNRTPPSTRPPGSFGNSGLMNQPKTSPISRNRNQSSSSDEEPLVGRPPFFESVRQPIAQPSNSGYSFGDTSAKGRGNVFGGVPHGGSFSRFG